MLKVRAGNDQFVAGWLARVAHGPCVYQAEFVRAAAAGAQL